MTNATMAEVREALARAMFESERPESWPTWGEYLSAIPDPETRDVWLTKADRLLARLDGMTILPTAEVERLERAYTLLISSTPALWRAHRDSPNETARRLNAMLHDAAVDWCCEYQKATGRGDQGLTRIQPALDAPKDPGASS